ncbi:MAG: ankyrin repeat domain-containing protein, partial [Nitrosopumilus sp.]
LLEDPRVKPEHEKESVAEALSIAIARKNIEIIKLLLSDKRVDPGADFNRPIKVASQFGNLEVVKMLINNPKVDPSAPDLSNNEENFSIKSAATGTREGKTQQERNDFFDIVKLLLTSPKVIGKLSEDEVNKYKEMTKEKIVKESI